jgi:NAD(P)H dehydrogenase (quinone)
MILVTGAAGKTGKAVLSAVAARGIQARAFVRTQEQAAEVDAQEHVVGDLADSDALNTACRGISTVYHICPNIHPQEAQIGASVIRAARKAGVDRLIYHSVLYPQIKAMPHHWNKLKVEELIIKSGMDFTILQPASYMQNISLSSVRQTGVIRVPYPIEALFSPVDLQDVAEAAALVIFSPGHSGAIYELAGPQVLATSEMARTVGDVLGKEIQAEEIARADWKAKAQLTEKQQEALLAMFRYYADHGFWTSSWTISQLLGRSPSSFEDFIRRELGVPAKSSGAKHPA